MKQFSGILLTALLVPGLSFGMMADKGLAQDKSSNYVEKTAEIPVISDLGRGLEALMDQVFKKEGPQGYEEYRLAQVQNAQTVEEFLAWATPEEIAEEFGTSDLAENEDSYKDLIEKASTGGATVQINISFNKNNNGTLTMTSPDGTVSGGATGARPGYSTPRGCYHPGSVEAYHWSRKYKAPMPFSVFYKGGAALHQGSLGVRSHGCIHLQKSTAQAVFNTVKKYGRTNTVICVH